MNGMAKEEEYITRPSFTTQQNSERKNRNLFRKARRESKHCLFACVVKCKGRGMINRDVDELFETVLDEFVQISELLGQIREVSENGNL